jgi:6-phosphogluconate dehydrogenase
VAVYPPQSFLIEISAIIANKKDEEAGGFLLDKIVDKTGAKGTGEAVGCCV